MAISLLTAAWQLAQGKSGSLLLVLETGAGLLLVLLPALLPALLSKWLRFYLCQRAGLLPAGRPYWTPWVT
ncbi:protein of unknown function [Lactobacillus delbrueckii subsp. delbrueckii]|uniref:Uncharacterized protein n=1 Tax=Lactobacillus delbrueckii subsp. delbrueckii TaxID=83684 RepID=A0AAU9R248_9LACO|nr:protein of unknown function [Lactobacillus delbrueckii subsp. delbrueckii]